MVYLLTLHDELWFASVSVAWYDLEVETAIFYFYWFLSWCFAYNWCSGNSEKEHCMLWAVFFFLRTWPGQCRPDSNADRRHSKSAGPDNFSVHEANSSNILHLMVTVVTIMLLLGLKNFILIWRICKSLQFQWKICGFTDSTDHMTRRM
jgi:hypothetical protein